MENKKHQKRIATFIVVLVLAIFELTGFIAGCILSDSDIWHLFKFYTYDSNFLNMIVCIIALPFLYKAMKDDNYLVPRFVRQLRFAVTVCLTLTFLTVVCVLAPVSHNWKSALLSPSNIFNHVLCPIISFVSFLFLEESDHMKFKWVCVGFAPTVLYSIVTSIMAFALHWGNGAPYFFLKVYNQPLWQSVMWLFIIDGLAFIITVIIWTCDHYINKEKIISEGEEKNGTSN